MRRGLSYANVMSTIAVFLALGGVTYAAVKLPRNSVGVKQLKRNAVVSAKVKNGSLRARDFRAGELPAGAAGATGPVGPAGPKGDTGTVDTSAFYDKAASDERFLGKAAKAADAERLDGIDSTVFGASKLCTAGEFAPAPGSAAKTDETTGGGVQFVTTAGALDCYPDLPQGARITNVRFYYRDNSGDSWRFALMRATPSTQSDGDIDDVYSTGAQAGARFVDLAIDSPNAVVNDALTRMVVRITADQTGSSMGFWGARIDYTL